MQSSPLDYLNQIAVSPPQKKGLSIKFKLVIGIGLGLIVAVLIVGGIINSAVAARKEPWEELAVKLNSTETIVNDASKYIKNSQLRSLNSTVKLFITNTKRDITTPLTTVGVNATKLPTDLVNKEAKSGMTDRLEVGRLNAKYDSTYAREMGYQLTSILILLHKLYINSNSQANKDFLKTTYDNLAPSQKEISDFSASNE